MACAREWQDDIVSPTRLIVRCDVCGARMLVDRRWDALMEPDASSWEFRLAATGHYPWSPTDLHREVERLAERLLRLQGADGTPRDGGA